MIEIFKTTVYSREQSHKLVTLLQRMFPGTSFIFDLEDCDKILRAEPVQSDQVDAIKNKLTALGFGCEILEG